MNQLGEVLLHLLANRTLLCGAFFAILREFGHFGFVEGTNLSYLASNFDQIVELFDLKVLDDTLGSVFEDLLKLECLCVEPHLEDFKLRLIFQVLLV